MNHSDAWNWIDLLLTNNQVEGYFLCGEKYLTLRPELFSALYNFKLKYLSF